MESYGTDDREEASFSGEGYKDFNEEAYQYAVDNQLFKGFDLIDESKAREIFHYHYQLNEQIEVRERWLA